jgi:hypothetical protein
VYAAGKVFEFNLQGTSRLLWTLGQCVKYHLHPESVEAANPFVKSYAPPSAVPPATAAPETATAASSPAPNTTATSPEGNSDRRLEATEFLADVLGQAGITGYRMLSSTELTKLSVDAAWTNGKEIGAVNIVEQTKDFGPNEAEAILISQSAKGCHGKFLSGSKSGDSKANDIEAFTSCTDQNGIVTTLFSLVPKDDAHLYVLRTIESEPTGSSTSSDRAKDIDASIRDAAYKIIK